MRPKPSIKIRISVGGKDHLLSLIPQPYPGKYWIRYNDKKAEKMPECTISDLMVECRKIIVKGEKCANNNLKSK